MEPMNETATDAKVIEPTQMPYVHQHQAASRSNLTAVLVILAAAGLLFLFVAVGAVGATFLFLARQNLVAQMDGELQPALRRDLFAPDDGEIEEMMVKPGDLVEEGQVLLALRSDALNAQHEAVLTELQSAKQHLAAGRELMVCGGGVLEDLGQRRSFAKQSSWTRIKV